MGIHGIYKEIGPGERIALSKLAVEKFEETGRPLRIAIDVSIWLFQIQASKGGTNPAPRTFYYRLLRLVAFSIHPVFVFDGPNKPPFKRGKRTGANVSSVPDFLAKQLIKQFGFPIHYAPGEAEAECALLQREGIVDAVLSEDVDTLMFGSGLTIRNWSPEQKSSKTPTHVNVYDAVKTKSGASGLDREGMILVALMSGGDYVPEGIPGCGPKTACEAARAGFGKDLCRLKKSEKVAIQQWKEKLQHELKTNESKLFKRKHGALQIPDDFPRMDILHYYTHPVISSSSGLDTLRRSIKWDQDIDFAGLRSFTHDAFDWIRLEGAKHFIRCLAPSLLVRELRLRGNGKRLISDNLEAVREDEALVIKGVHGKRQHVVTDNMTELRLSFTPIELVKIDLSKEDPDEEALPGGTQADEEDLDAVELEDEEEDGPKKRGPTKFDPAKAARVWVLESFAMIGAPLAVEDYEAKLRRPYKSAAERGAGKTAPKGKGARRAKTTGDVAQTSIQSFAKVTKPATRGSKTVAAKPQPASAPSQTASSPPTKLASKTIVDLLSSSPAKAAEPHAKVSSISPIQEELPSSVTKRRQRAPMQRSRTLPADLSVSQDRPLTPPPLGTIDMLDLISSPAGPSPSPLPTKKARTRNAPPPRSIQSHFVAASPGKSKQTTLDAWSQSSPAATPTKPRITAVPSQAPIPPPPAFTSAETNAIDSLDLTASSPPRAPLGIQPSQQHLRRTTASRASPRPPLQSISSNASFASMTSESSSASKTSRATKTSGSTGTRRTSPRLRKTSPAIEELDLTGTVPLTSMPGRAPSRRKSPSPLPGVSAAPALIAVEELDLTTLSSSPPTQLPPASHHQVAPPPPPQLASPPPTQALPEPRILRRSPRNSDITAHFAVSKTVSVSTVTTKAKGGSPPAAWKSRAKKKREIILRKSVVGAWDFAELSSSPVAASVDTGGVGIGGKVGVGGGSGVVLKGKERRRWRESEIEVLDLCMDD